MKYDYKSIIEEIKKEGKNILRSESIEEDTFFIEGIQDVSNGKGVITVNWYWSKNLLKLAFGFKECSIREHIVELFPGGGPDDFPEEVKKSYDYTLIEIINQLKEVCPKKCHSILEDVQVFIDKYETTIARDDFCYHDLLNLIHEWNKVSYSLITISLSNVYENYHKVIDHLNESFDIYIEELDSDSEEIEYDLEDLKEQLLNC